MKQNRNDRPQGMTHLTCSVVSVGRVEGRCRTEGRRVLPFDEVIRSSSRERYSLSRPKWVLMICSRRWRLALTKK